MANYQLTARDIMQVEVATILGDLSISDAAEIMRLEGVRSLIVEPRSPDDPYGIITFSDIVSKVLAPGLDPADLQVHKIMTKPVVTIQPGMKVEYIARLFTQSGFGHTLVMDCGELLGVVSMTDLITETITDLE